MWPDWVSILGPLAPKPDMLTTAQCSPAKANIVIKNMTLYFLNALCTKSELFLAPKNVRSFCLDLLITILKILQ